MDHMRPSPVPQRGMPQGYGSQPAARRGPGPMLAGSSAIPHQPLSQAQLHQQHQAAIQERELQKRRAKKPTDRTIPPGVEEIVPNVAVYRDLAEMERRYDATIMRKRLDIQDAVNRNVKNTKILRVFISNTAKDQPWQNSDRPLDENAFDFDTGQIPTFRVKIEGRLVDGDGEAAETNPDHDLGLEPFPNASSIPQPPRKKFSTFFKAITVELDRNKDVHPESNFVEWRRPGPHAVPGGPNAAGNIEFDAFEFERKGDENLNCTIKLFRDEIPDRFKLSPLLADLLGTKEDTRAGIVMGIWEYVRVNGLQDMDERRTINCDQALRNIFNTDRLYFPQIPELTIAHIFPLDPIVIPYVIRTDVPSHFSSEVHDIRICVDDPIRTKMASLLSSPVYSQSLREITQIDEQIAVLVQAINHSKAKRDFYKAFSEDPANFVNRWIASQKRDLDMLSGEGTGAAIFEEEEIRREGFFRDVGENVYLLLARGVNKGIQHHHQ